MKDSLMEIYEQFGNSEPVFVFRKSESRDASEIRFEVLNKYNPIDHMNSGDHVETIMVNSWSEHFSREKNKFVTNDRLFNSARDNMAGLINRLFKSASPLKNPEQSKLYKFLCTFNIHHDKSRQELYVSLIRYVQPHVDWGNYRFKNGSDCPHAKNFIAILEKVRAKYER